VVKCRRSPNRGPAAPILAVARRSLGLVLVTNNLREFERMPWLSVENWAN
jgi:tRNA(fMet)-specific endonuclease VapC